MKTIVHILFTSIVLLSLLGCKNDPYPGFSKTDSGIFYKIQVIGDGQVKAKSGDKVTVRIGYRPIETSNAAEIKAVPNTIQNLIFPETRDWFWEAISMLSEGDSASFIVPSDSVLKFFSEQTFPANLQGKDVQVDIALLGLNLFTDKDYEELKRLQDYVKENGLKGEMLDGGIFYAEIKKGNGEKIVYGKRISIHYSGSFLDGKQFDSTRDMPFPFEFVYGSTGQIIKGLEMGLKQMSEGGKAKLIIPSFLAFGEAGSTTGIVPPFTTLIYDVEVIKVEKKINSTGTLEEI